MTRTMDPINPAEILFEKYIGPLNLGQNRLANVIGVPPRRINEIVLGKRRITADSALRMSRYFGTSERFWMNLQSHFYLELERDQIGKDLEQITPLIAS
jgi:addiction module HigA family antidote